MVMVGRQSAARQDAAGSRRTRAVRAARVPRLGAPSLPSACLASDPLQAISSQDEA
jgi:hypothetical protein